MVAEVRTDGKLIRSDKNSEKSEQTNKDRTQGR